MLSSNIVHSELQLILDRFRICKVLVPTVEAQLCYYIERKRDTEHIG